MSVTHIDVPVPVPVEGMCPLRDVLDVVGDKWSVLAVVMLGERRHRFNELHRNMPGISQRMLTRTLRNLARDGFISRTVYPEVPPRVDYELTGLGRSLLDQLNALNAWADAHHDEILAARHDQDSPAQGSRDQESRDAAGDDRDGPGRRTVTAAAEPARR
ncbi:MAG TPA: helix-turn-helix domain-containing protein [Trebonia sp.]